MSRERPYSAGESPDSIPKVELRCKPACNILLNVMNYVLTLAKLIFILSLEVNLLTLA